MSVSGLGGPIPCRQSAWHVVLATCFGSPRLAGVATARHGKARLLNALVRLPDDASQGLRLSARYESRCSPLRAPPQ